MKTKKQLVTTNNLATVVNGFENSEKNIRTILGWQNNHRVTNVWTNIQTMRYLIIDWASKTYRVIPRNTIKWLMIALVIFVWPFDIPGIADDVLALVLMVYGGLNLDLEEYRQWKISTMQ